MIENSNGGPATQIHDQFFHFNELFNELSLLGVLGDVYVYARARECFENFQLLESPPLCLWDLPEPCEATLPCSRGRLEVPGH